MKSTREFLKGRSFPGFPVKANREPSSLPPVAGSDDATAEQSKAPLVPEARQVSGVAALPSKESQGSVLSSPSRSDAEASFEAAGDASHSSSPADNVPDEVCASSKSEPVTDRSKSSTHVAKFERILAEKVVDMESLRKVSWSGIPPHLRPLAWRLLLGYLPPNRDRRSAVLHRKRREYTSMLPEFYGEGRGHSEEEQAMLHQVEIDAPRTAPGDAFFHQAAIQQCLIRILYIWGLRHPASGYVQGINDLVTPFIAVFLSEHFNGPTDSWDTNQIDESLLMDVEADCYWCLCKVLDSIQDHYTYAQPGIQRKVFKVKELVRRIDVPLADHLEAEGVEFMHFAHRWVNCLLVREVPLRLGIRLWDTYLAELEDFGEFLVYVCSSFLCMWSQELRAIDFQDIMMLLQKMPTSGWGEREIETVLAKAFLWRTSFGNARSHLSA